MCSQPKFAEPVCFSDYVYEVLFIKKNVYRIKESDNHGQEDMCISLVLRLCCLLFFVFLSRKMFFVTKKLFICRKSSFYDMLIGTIAPRVFYSQFICNDKSRIPSKKPTHFYPIKNSESRFRYRMAQPTAELMTNRSQILSQVSVTSLLMNVSLWPWQ